MSSTTPTPTKDHPKLSALGFCGADDTVNPRLLALIGQKYPSVEFGILFRPDKEGLPRYASKEWVSRLSSILLNNANENNVPKKVRLAAHLCGSHVNDLLSSSTDSESKERIDSFMNQLLDWGFTRVQVNATAVNGVATETLADVSTMESFLRTVGAHPRLEFIVQKNDETLPLWSGLLGREGELPKNIVFLHDESKGTGKETVGGWPTDSRCVTTERKIVGFAGGINPTNVKSKVLSASEACLASGGKEFWIDMESGVRTTLLHSDGNGNDWREDVFDLLKCYKCIDVVCEAGLMVHPSELR